MYISIDRKILSLTVNVLGDIGSIEGNACSPYDQFSLEKIIMTNTLKSESARLGHIKRRLRRAEPLMGDLLKLALDVVGDGNTDNELTDRIAKKLKTGQSLDDYELHLMEDVFLLHARLASANSSH